MEQVDKTNCVCCICAAIMARHEHRKYSDLERSIKKRQYMRGYNRRRYREDEEFRSRSYERGRRYNEFNKESRRLRNIIIE